MNDEMMNTIQLDGPYLDILRLKQNGYCCSQIVVKLVLRDLGRDNPDLVRSMAALCFGTGSSGGTCGVLCGAACALSLCLETFPDRDRQAPEFPLLLGELIDWFTVRAEGTYGGTRCEQILSASPDKRACADLMTATLEKLQSMLATMGGAENGCINGHP